MVGVASEAATFATLTTRSCAVYSPDFTYQATSPGYSERLRCSAHVATQTLSHVQLQGMAGDRRHGRWQHVSLQNGTKTYYNRMLNQTAEALSEEQQPYLLLAPLPPLNPYKNELYLPLKEYIEHEVAFELLHNGQTLQVRSSSLRCALHILHS